MKLHNTMYFYVSLTMFLDFVTWPPFTKMCDAKKGGQVTKSGNIVRLT